MRKPCGKKNPEIQNTWGENRTQRSYKHDADKWRHVQKCSKEMKRLQISRAMRVLCKVLGAESLGALSNIV